MAILFFSYSHKDESMRDELEVHLAMLKRQGVIETWHDRRIVAGSDLDNAIAEQLESADIILLLVSPYFLASDYCYDVEMTRALDRHSEGTAHVIPVILEPCDWHAAPFGKLMAVPTDGKPVAKFANINDAFLEITKAIRKVCTQLQSNSENGPIQQSSKSKQQLEHQHRPRSSNLRISRNFTDNDRDVFLDETFEYIANFFENSLSELEARNAEIKTRFKRVSSDRLTAYIYRNGESISECCIRHSSSFGRQITYSSTASSDDSYNDALSIDDDGHILQLRPAGFSLGQQNKGPFSQQGAAEYFWSILMERLQRGA